MCADEAALTKVIVRLAILVCGIQDKAQRDDLRAGGVVLVSHFSAPGRLSTFVGQCDRNSESDGRIAHGYQSFPHLLEQRPQFRGAMPTCSCSIPSGRFQLFRLQPLCRLVLDASREVDTSRYIALAHLFKHHSHFGVRRDAEFPKRIQEPQPVPFLTINSRPFA